MQLHLEQDKVYCQDGSLFDRVAFSRFKYGYVLPAHRYGIGLARLIEAELLEKRDNRPTIIISAPYKFVPTASHAIALAMRRVLAERFIELGLEPPVVVPFHKAITGTGAYAKSSLEERLRILATLGLSIDERLVRGANVLAVDDIRITGVAETTTAGFIEPLEPHSVWYLHAARIVSYDDEKHHGIENELNQSSPKNLTTILRDIRAGEFMLNARALGIILKTSATPQFERFLLEVPNGTLEQLFEATICSGPAYVARFPHAPELLKSELRRRGNVFVSLTQSV